MPCKIEAIRVSILFVRQWAEAPPADGADPQMQVRARNETAFPADAGGRQVVARALTCGAGQGEGISRT
jgi:hypothetical protein